VLRHVDGWDPYPQNENDQKQLKYPQSYITFLQQGGFSPAPGPAGSSSALDQGFFLFNTAFGEANFQRTFDQQPTWFYALDFQMAGVPAMAPYPVMEWCRFTQGAKPSGVKLCSLTTTATGQMTVTFYDGTPSENPLVSFTTTATLAANQYTHLDFTATFTGSGSFILRFFSGGVPSIVLQNTGVGLGLLYPLPDTVTVVRWQGFGPPGVAIDNTVIWDAQNNGDGFTGLMPQQRVTTVVMTEDLNANWSPFLAAPTLNQDAVSPLRFNTPMSDYDYAIPNNGNAVQLFNAGAVPCYGLINAVALNVDAKAVPPIGSLPQITLLCRETVALNPMGVFSLLNLFPSSISSLVRGYWNFQAIAARSLQTGNVWQANNLSQIAWGMQADPGNLPERVSAVYLEVLTDVSGLSFTCGGPSNYSY
jgi:hypothetical protein